MIAIAQAAIQPLRAIDEQAERGRPRWDGPFYCISITIVLAVAAAYLFSRFSGTDSAWSSMPLDDNWIHLVYARSLATEGWFYYNPGVAESGMSSPLWVVLLAAVYKWAVPLGVSPQWVAKGLSLLCGLAVPIVTYHLALELGLARGWAWAAGLVTTIEPNLAFGNVAAMEVPLYTLLTVLAAWLSWRHRYGWLGLVLALLVLTRGEGALTAVLIGAVPLIRLYLQRKDLTLVTEAELRLGFRLFLPSLLLGGAWAIFNLIASGHFLPNTYYVKHDPSLGWFDIINLWHVLRGYVGRLALFEGVLALSSLALLAAAAWYLYERGLWEKGVVLLLIPVVQVLAFAQTVRVVPLATPWSYFTRRYLDAMLPFMIILLIVGLFMVWERAGRMRVRWVVLGVPVAVAGVSLLTGLSLFSLNRYFMEQYSWNSRNIEEVSVTVGRWVGEHLPPGATIALTDAGAIRFFARGDQTVIDLIGLNCHTCVHRHHAELIHAFRPAYGVLFREGLDVLAGMEYEELFSAAAVRNTILGGRELVVVRILTPPTWPLASPG